MRKTNTYIKIIIYTKKKKRKKEKTETNNCGENLITLTRKKNRYNNTRLIELFSFIAHLCSNARAMQVKHTKTNET